MQPYRIQYILESKHTAKQESKYCGKETTAGNNRRQAHLLCPIKSKAPQKQAEPLPGITKHEAKQKGIG